jgi:hypothetical protein
MSSTRRRAAFDPSALADLDDLLPSVGPAPTHAPAPSNVSALRQPAAAAPPTAQPAGEPAPAAPPKRRTGAAATQPATDEAPQRVSRVVAPEVALAPEVYKALRELTLRERNANPTSARTYGQVVLDAIEENADALAQHWTSRRPASRSGLFKRVDPQAPRRRRHLEAPARVPLAGIIASDAEQLDQLAMQWGAGSRSALAEQALKMYLQL